MLPEVAPPQLRSLEQIALENAVEGCVNETYAALEAQWRAEHASDGELAEALRAIAADEARHAALSWRVAAWAAEHLDAEAQARVRAAQLDAVARLRESVREEPEAELVAISGLPTAAQAGYLVDSLAQTLWASA